MATETRQAFITALERTHGRQLRRYLAARLRNAHADVPDLMQEIFLRLLRLDNHEAIRNTQAYLYTIASHVLHQHALKQAATETMGASETLLELVGAEQEDPAVELESEQNIERLARGLELISPRAYVTLVLHRGNGVSLGDIANQLGVSYSMTKKYLAQALKYCHKRLGELE